MPVCIMIRLLMPVCFYNEASGASVYYDEACEASVYSVTYNRYQRMMLMVMTRTFVNVSRQK